MYFDQDFLDVVLSNMRSRIVSNTDSRQYIRTQDVISWTPEDQSCVKTANSAGDGIQVNNTLQIVAVIVNRSFSVDPALKRHRDDRTLKLHTVASHSRTAQSDRSRSAEPLDF